MEKVDENYVLSTKSELTAIRIDKLEETVKKGCYVALRQYFDGAGNGPEAKVAYITLGVMARETQSANGSRALDLLEKKYNAQRKLLPTQP